MCVCFPKPPECPSVPCLTGGLQGVQAGVVEDGDLLQMVEVWQGGQVIEVCEGVVGQGEDDEARRQVLVAAVQGADAIPVQKQLLKFKET